MCFFFQFRSFLRHLWLAQCLEKPVEAGNGIFCSWWELPDTGRYFTAHYWYLRVDLAPNLNRPITASIQRCRPPVTMLSQKSVFTKFFEFFESFVYFSAFCCGHFINFPLSHSSCWPRALPDDEVIRCTPHLFARKLFKLSRPRHFWRCFTQRNAFFDASELYLAATSFIFVTLMPFGNFFSSFCVKFDLIVVPLGDNMCSKTSILFLIQLVLPRQSFLGSQAYQFSIVDVSSH